MRGRHATGAHSPQRRLRPKVWGVHVTSVNAEEEKGLEENEMGRRVGEGDVPSGGGAWGSRGLKDQRAQRVRMLSDRPSQSHAAWNEFDFSSKGTKTRLRVLSKTVAWP